MHACPMLHRQKRRLLWLFSRYSFLSGHFSVLKYFLCPRFSVLMIETAQISRGALVPMQKVARLEGKFASKFNDGDAAVDGVNVHNANRAGDGCHPVHQFFIGIHNHDGRVTRAPVIGRSDEILDLGFREFIDLFQK